MKFLFKKSSLFNTSCSPQSTTPSVAEYLCVYLNVESAEIRDDIPMSSSLPSNIHLLYFPVNKYSVIKNEHRLIWNLHNISWYIYFIAIFHHFSTIIICLYHARLYCVIHTFPFLFSSCAAFLIMVTLIKVILNDVTYTTLAALTAHTELARYKQGHILKVKPD